MSSPLFFQFETDFVESLRCIPMQVRYKLDTCGIKLKLEQWHQFSAPQREQLVTLPCDAPAEIAAYRTYLADLILTTCGTAAQELPIDPAPPWLDATTLPVEVTSQAAQFQVTLSAAAWATLSPLQRFALGKLSRPGHENRNFLPALKEFDLV